MTDLMSVLHPATPPEPKGARLIKGSMGNLHVDEPDHLAPPKKLSPHTTKEPCPELWEYKRIKMREYRQRKREEQLKRKRDHARKKREEKQAATLAELKGEKSCPPKS